MKAREQRSVERPFKDKRLLRVCEYIDSHLTHAWLVRMTDDGGTTIARWDIPSEKPEWLSVPEPSCPGIHLV